MADLPGRTLTLLALLAFGDAFSYAVILPVLPLVAERIGMPTLAIGLTFGAFSACQLLAAPLLGALGDRYGIKRVLLACQGGTIVGFALLWGLASPWLLLISRLIDGASAGNISLLYGSVLKALPAAEWRGAFATLAAATSGGILTGLLAAAVLVPGGFNLLVAAVVGCALLLLLATAYAFPARLSDTAQSERIAFGPGALMPLLAVPGVRPVLGLILIATVLQTAFLATLPLLLARLLGFAESETTRFLVVLFLVAALWQVGILRLLATRLSSVGLALVAFLLAVLGGGIFALARGTLAIWAGAIGLIGACALLGPVLTTLLSHRAPALREATLMGVNQSAVSVGQLLGPVAGYALLATESTVAPRALLSLLGLAGLTLLALLPGRHDERAH